MHSFNGTDSKSLLRTSIVDIAGRFSNGCGNAFSLLSRASIFSYHVKRMIEPNRQTNLCLAITAALQSPTAGTDPIHPADIQVDFSLHSIVAGEGQMHFPIAPSTASQLLTCDD
jgi:hypothetical protein